MSAADCREGRWAEPVSGRAFAYRIWLPPSARALLVILHGYGEHGGRYLPMAEALARDAVAVAVPDVYGHGRSAGARGDIRDVAWCAGALRAMTEEIFCRMSGTARYAVFGHSFGGLLALRWAAEAPPGFQRVIAQAPLLEVGFRIPRWKSLLASLMAVCCPAGSLPLALDVSLLSHDPQVVEAYRTDPLVHSWMSARSYRSILRAKRLVLGAAGTWRVPVLLMYGTADQIISVGVAQAWFDRLTGEKRCIAFPGAYHELHHEPVRDEALDRVREWILA